MAKRIILLVVVFLAGGMLGSWATVRTGRLYPVALLVSTSKGEAIGRQVSFVNGFSPVAKTVQPAVVNIASTKIVRSPDQGETSPFFSDPFFRQFFGNDFSRQFNIPREERERSLGSGVLVNPDGYILTNNHVVAGADQIQVSLPDKRSFKGRVVGTDPKTDIAVVKIDAKDLPVLVLGDSSKAAVGDFVLAVGDPFGIGQTVTMGIISATGRGGLGIEDYEDFIQTDAAINPGNSGGAMVNIRGELVGVNTAILSGGGGNEGIGFAIPINMARAVMEQIIEHGKVLRGSMGVVIQPVTPELAKSFGLSGEPRGALISQVNPGSPAERAGLKEGDIILALNGTPVTGSRDLSLKIGQMAPGATVNLTVFHDGKEQNISVTLGELPSKPPGAAPSVEGNSSGPRLGMSVETLTPQAARQLGLPAQTTGVVITGVDPGSAAEAAGLRRGDVIQQVDRKPVTSVDQLRSAVQHAGSQGVLLLIDRAGEHIYVVVEPQS